MVIFPMIVATAALAIAVFVAMIVFFIIRKTGLTILCMRLKLRLPGLVWIPYYGTWFYEALIIKKLMGNNKCVFWIHFLMNFSLNVASNVIGFSFKDHSNPTYLMLKEIMMYALVVVVIARIVFRILAMYKGGFSLWAAIAIGIFFSEVWSYFMIFKAGKFMKEQENAANASNATNVEVTAVTEEQTVEVIQ